MSKLNQHDIHEIFSQISQSLNCVECKSNILPHNIKITNIIDNECQFDVNCHRCACEMNLSAHIEKTPTKAAMAYNKSSQIIHNNIVEEGISELEVIAIKNELRNFCGSFIQAFAK